MNYLGKVVPSSSPSVNALSSARQSTENHKTAPTGSISSTYEEAVFHFVDGDVVVVHTRCARVDARVIAVLPALQLRADARALAAISAIVA